MKLSELARIVNDALKQDEDMNVVLRIKDGKTNDEADANTAGVWRGPDYRPQRPQFYIECVDE